MAETTPVIFSAEDLEISFGERKILDKTGMTVHEGERIGLVGRNGCGKSTFLRILAETEMLSSGSITRQRGLTTAFLPQEFLLAPDKNVYDNIMDGAAYLREAIEEYETLPLDSARHTELENIINAHDGWNLDVRIKMLMEKLKTPPPEASTENLSGGEKRRVALARALLSRPDLLLLDEPTNHLDTGSIEWIENFLASYRGTCIFVTHDRYFLDRIATKIVELNNGQFYTYDGNYSDFLLAKAEREALEDIQDHKRKQFLRKELDWVSRMPKARGTKSKGRLDRYNELAAQKGPEREMDVELVLPPADKLGNKIVDLKNAGVSYGDKKLFSGFDFSFEGGMRLGVVGKNGVGKTTLLKLIMGENTPSQGTVKIADTVRFNYVDQEKVRLDEEKTVFEEVGEGKDFVMFGDEKLGLWGYLKRFLFADERIKTKVSRLSGGERARLMLAKILCKGGNFIILDEPTNDLDLPTLRLLEEALVDFKGCVLAVSHDRYFLNRICTGILSFDENGEISYNVGNYDYVMQRLENSVELEQPKEKSSAKDAYRASKEKKAKLTWKQKMELEGMEDAVLELESRIEEIEELFSSPDFFKEHGDRASEFEKELSETRNKLEELYQRWEELEQIKSESEA